MPDTTLSRGPPNRVPTPVNSVLWAILEKSTKLPPEWERYRRQPDRLKALLRTALKL